MWQTLRELVLRIAGPFTRRRRDRELSEELEFHLALKQARHQDHGVAPAEAASQSRRDFGGLERWKERCRDAATLQPLEDLERDLRLAFRMLRKSPIFTCVAIATLAAAISANTTIFSLLNTVLLKAVDVPHPDRLALLRIQPGAYGYSFSYPWFKAIEKQSSTVIQAFAFTGRNLLFKTNAGVENLSAQLVSGNYFPALQVAPMLGRYITPQDDRAGTPEGNIAVISGSFWRSHFGGDPKVLGRKLTLNHAVFTIAGVMPEFFLGVDRDQHPDVFLPLESEPLLDAPFNNIAGGYQAWWLRVAARLNPKSSVAQAAVFLRANSHSITHGKETPSSFQFNGYKLDDLYLTAESGLGGFSSIRLRFAKPLEILMGLVGLVLLVACLNLATLLIARAAARRREISLRFALGASRFRLVRQLLTECLLLSFAGSLVGMPAAVLLTRTLALVIVPQHATEIAQIDTTPNVTVFAFTALVAALVTLVTGVAPALRSTDRELDSGLREASVTVRAVDRRRLWPRILLALEVAAALVLVTGASLLGYSFLKLHRLPLGFDPAGLVHLSIDIVGQVVPATALPERYRQMTERLSALPGVSAVSLCQVVPFSGSESTTEVALSGNRHQELWVNVVGPSYFRTMRTALREGREFRWSDTNAKTPVAILNVSAAKALFSERRALGEHMPNHGPEIIGIVDDAKYSSIRKGPPPTIYYSAASAAYSTLSSLTILLRTSGPAAPLVAAASEVVHRELPEIPRPVAITMEDTLNESLASERILTMLASFFGVLALAITGIGLYGTLAYMTERRTGEIGIRLALGARRSNIASLICGENSAIALSGCLAGLLASLLASRLLASFLFGVTPRDPLAFGAAAMALLFVAVAASLLPALKAARIDPLAAIRHE